MRADLPWLGVTWGNWAANLGLWAPSDEPLGRTVSAIPGQTTGASPFHRNYLPPSTPLDLLVGTR